MSTDLICGPSRMLRLAEHVIKHELRKVLGKVPRQPKVEPGTCFNYTPPDFLNFTYGPFVNASEHCIVRPTSTSSIAAALRCRRRLLTLCLN
ncbi:hypothetical protein [Stenotrophomonas phage CM2]